MSTADVSRGLSTVVAPAAPPSANDARGSWIHGRLWDVVWIQSALWLLPLAFLLANGYGDLDGSPFDALVFALTALFWLAHRFGSTWLAYATTAYRPLVREEPVRFVVIPVAITVVCFAIMLPAEHALPLTRAERVIALATIDFVFVTWHFAAQHFGILSLYRLRAGRAKHRWTRRVDRLFTLGVGGAVVVVVEAITRTDLFQEIWVPPWVAEDWLPAMSETLRIGATSAVLAVTIAVLAFEVLASRVSLPRVLYVVGVSLMVSGALWLEQPYLFVGVWAAQHWLAATALTTRVASAEPEPPGSASRRALHAVNRRPWALLSVLVSLSVLLLPLMEIESVRAEGVYYGERLFGELAVALRSSEWVPALVALGFTTGFLHYWLDRAVFRFSRPAVRVAARGLL
jgi:hypothetical protein